MFNSEAVDRLTAVRNGALRCGERPSNSAEEAKFFGECKPGSLGPGLDHAALAYWRAPTKRVSATAEAYN